MSAIIRMRIPCSNVRLTQRAAARLPLHGKQTRVVRHAYFFHPGTPSASPAVRVSALCEDGSCLPEENGSVLVQDDLDSLLQILPADIRVPLMEHPNRANLLEVVLDLGRRPEARFLGSSGSETLRDMEVTRADLDTAEQLVGEFGSDNRAGITGTLHRISAIRNRKGAVVGLTCRVGRAVSGHIDMIRDILDSSNSLLFLGRPGVGKTTVIRELARVMADELHKRVVIVDTSNEIGGDGDIPHPAIGGARRMQVPDPIHQHNIMIEAVENHMPEVVIVDEISTEAEALACRTIAERGVMLIGTAHGIVLENLVKNPTLTDLVGGVESVTLGDDEARARGTQKTVLERRGPPTFPVVVEIRERTRWIAHWVEDSVDCLLNSRVPMVQIRQRDAVTGSVSVQEMRYDAADQMLLESDPEAPPANVYETLGAGSEGPAPASSWAQKLRSMSDQAALQEMSIMGLNGSSVMYKNTSVLMPATAKRKRSKAKARRN